jgi:dienelactone hydrolase
MELANKKAIIVLHEIYGINEFIKNRCQQFKDAGFDVICPNLIGRDSFPYEAAQEAYDHFALHVGFEVYKEISALVRQLKETYETVFIVGFSIGATIAWRCCEQASCDGIIACYGSRIRDYTELTPVCPTLLLFAKKDSFDVQALVFKLQGKEKLSILQFEAVHGFLDTFSTCFDLQQSDCAERAISDFLSEHAYCG